MKLKYILISTIWLFQAPAWGLDIYLNNPPGDYRVYEWNNRTVKHTSYTKNYSKFKFSIPDEYLIRSGDGKVDVTKSLDNWRRSTPVADGNPRTVRGIGFYPFADENGNRRYVALKYLANRIENYDDTTVTKQTQTYIPPTQKTITTEKTLMGGDPEPIEPGVESTGEIPTPSPRPEHYPSDDSIMGTAELQTASAEQTGLCSNEKADVDKYRAQGSSAPKSTAAYATCLEKAGRNDLAQAARQDRLDFIKNRKASAPSAPQKDETDKKQTNWHDNSYAGAIKKLEAWNKANIRALDCRNGDLRDTATCAVCNCFNEAESDTDAGKVMVNRVAMARMRWKGAPKTFCGSVTNKPRGGAYWFSWIYESIKDRKATGPQLRRCVQASITALKAGPSEADHYHATYVYPSWRNHCRIKYGQIGKHIYYKGQSDGKGMCLKANRRQSTSNHDIVPIGR